MLKSWTKHWWWIILPMMIAALVVAYAGPTSTYDFFCKGEGSCFREWVSALSGWAAAGAAAFTIRTMLVVQRENVDIQLHPRITLARIVRRRANADKKRLVQLAALKELSGDRAFPLSNDQAKAFRRLVRSFSHADFDDFERVEFVGATYLSSVRSSLDKSLTMLNLYQGDPNGKIRKNVLWPQHFDNMSKALARAEEHNARIARAANRFIKRWRHRGVGF